MEFPSVEVPLAVGMDLWSHLMLSETTQVQTITCTLQTCFQPLEQPGDDETIRGNTDTRRFYRKYKVYSKAYRKII
jgi:hypothetical protein